MRAHLSILLALTGMGVASSQTYGWVLIERDLTEAYYNQAEIATWTNTTGTTAYHTLAGSWARPYFLRGSTVACPWGTPFNGDLIDTTEYFQYSDVDMVPATWRHVVYATYLHTFGNEEWIYIPPPPGYQGQTQYGQFAPPPNYETGPFERTYERTTNVSFSFRVFLDN